MMEAFNYNIDLYWMFLVSLFMMELTDWIDKRGE
jgi:hypothetical protein